jgi:hypothetical protein
MHVVGGRVCQVQLWSWHTPVNAFQPGAPVAYYQWTKNSLFFLRSPIGLRYTSCFPFFSTSVSFSFIHRKRLRPLISHRPWTEPHCTIHRIILLATSSHRYLNGPILGLLTIWATLTLWTMRTLTHSITLTLLIGFLNNTSPLVRGTYTINDK